MTDNNQSSRDTENARLIAQAIKRLMRLITVISVLMTVGILAYGVVAYTLPEWGAYGVVIGCMIAVGLDITRRLGYLSQPIVGWPQWRYVAYAALGPSLATAALTIWGKKGFSHSWAQS